MFASIASFVYYVYKTPRGAHDKVLKLKTLPSPSPNRGEVYVSYLLTAPYYESKKKIPT